MCVWQGNSNQFLRSYAVYLTSLTTPLGEYGCTKTAPSETESLTKVAEKLDEEDARSDDRQAKGGSNTIQESKAQEVF
jgi:hypothetical protein